MNGDKSKPNRIPDFEYYFQGAKNTDHIVGKILKSLLKSNLKEFIVSVLLFVIKNSPSWVIPLVLSNIVNIASNPDEGRLVDIYLNGAVLLVLILQNIYTHTLYVKYSSRMLRSIGAGFRNTLVKRLQQISITYHNELQSGKLQSKFIRDMETIENFLNQIMNTLLPAILSLVITLVISATRSWIVTVAFLLIIPATVLLRRAFSKPMQQNSRELRQKSETLSSNISEMIEMVPVTRAHGLEGEEIQKLERDITTLRDTGYNVDKVNALFGSTSWVMVQAISALCLLFTGTMAYKGYLTAGDVVLFQTYFNTLTGNVQTLLNIYPEFLKGAESIKSVSEIMISDKIENNKNKIKLRYLHGSVQFKNVSYRYPDSDKLIIKNFSLDVQPGTCVAFVGASGSGKTTIMNMIIGFLRATNGAVLIDGKPIEYLDLPSYRHFVSVVPQNSILFSGTIRDNILYGMHNVPEEQLQEVVDRANIREFISQLPQGLDTPVTEHGANLSGGQKQRISIARALIRDPKVIILDEATSALDNISEYHVQKAMAELIRGRTTFIVAHRLSTIRDADRIVVMEKGEMVECGSYGELMERRGAFYELQRLSEMTAK